MGDRDHSTRYDISKNTPDTWEVYDIKTGRTLVVGGQSRTGPKLGEADIYVDLLNSVDQTSDEETLR